MEQPNYDLNDLIRSLSRKLLYALPLALLAAALTYAVSSRLDPAYEATATVVAVQATDPNASNSAALTTPPLSADALTAVLLSDQIVVAALESVGARTVNQRLVEETREDVSVSVTEDTRFRLSNLFDISYVGSAPSASADMANALTASLIEWDSNRAQQNIAQRIETLERQVGALDENIESLRLMADLARQEELEDKIALRAQQQQELFYARALQSSAPGLLSIVQPAVTPLEPVAPKPLQYSALAFIGVTALTLTLLLFLNAVDTRVRSAQDVQVVGGVPVLAEITGRAGNHAPASKPVDLLRANLHRRAAEEPKVVMLTSLNATPSKSWLAAELAKSFTLSDHRTLLIDLDLTHPAFPTLYSNSSGASSRLEEHLNDPSKHTPTEVQLDSDRIIEVVFMSEDETVAGHLGRSFREALAYWQKHYDVVIVSGGPVLGNADTLTVTPLCGDTVLAVDLKSANRRDLQLAVAWLKRVGATELSAVTLRTDTAPAYEPTESKVSAARVQTANG